MTIPMKTMVRRGRPKNETRASWRERLAALRDDPPLVKLIWTSHSGNTAAVLALRFARGFVPVSTFWVGKLNLDTVLAVREGQASYATLRKYVALEVALILTGEILAR